MKSKSAIRTENLTNPFLPTFGSERRYKGNIRNNSTGINKGEMQQATMMLAIAIEIDVEIKERFPVNKSMGIEIIKINATLSNKKGMV